MKMNIEIKAISMNSSMKRLLSRVSFGVSAPRKEEIYAEINDFFEQVRMYAYEGDKCFSLENYFSTLEKKDESCLDLLYWEWDNNEISLNHLQIKRKYKESLLIALDYIEQLLKKYYPDNKFAIVASVQFGRYRNINIRIHLYRGQCYLGSDLEVYNQPVLQKLIQT